MFQDGQLQSRSWGDNSAPRYELDSSKLQRIEYEQFRILFKCLTIWGRNEAGDNLSERAFRVRTRFPGRSFKRLSPQYLFNNDFTSVACEKKASSLTNTVLVFHGLAGSIGRFPIVRRPSRFNL